MGFITPQNKAGYFLGGLEWGWGTLRFPLQTFSLFSLGDLGEPDSIPWDSNHHFSLTMHLEIFLSCFFPTTVSLRKSETLIGRDSAKM